MLMQDVPAAGVSLPSIFVSDAVQADAARARGRNSRGSRASTRLRSQDPDSRKEA